ncbi:NADP-dependent oxidoreductase [Labedella phragmitis]|uniref:NADP-dependent oxidoreductase n=1 Tax=Labedella phragmitis TaxID=2498849 RepID=A0A3S3ZSH8_9MICO|nr:NADP-dependent oxidoreductase [Labedella phragmitis]RWZ52699.1 NADP-dependent oxidoreductase [Labedella phragmitis]
MKAAQFVRFGDPGVIDVVDAAVPTPGEGEVLIRVAASSVNAVDASHRSGELGLITRRRFPQGLGVDAVGRIEGVGAGVTGFVKGERVWAMRAGADGLRRSTGLAAEFAVVHSHRVAPAPESLSDAEAAALIVGGYTALRAFRDVLSLRPGSRTLIRGASGGVGSAAVPIAAALGGQVIGVTSRRNGDLVRSLGAQEVFDYATATPSDVGSADVIFDTVGTQLSAWRSALSRNGRMATVAVGSAGALAAVGLSAIHGSRRIRMFAGEPPTGQLAALSAFVDANHIRPVVHETFRIDDIGRAHDRFDRGGVAGKLVIVM